MTDTTTQTKPRFAPGPWRLHLVDDTTIIDIGNRFIASACGSGDDLGGADYNNPDEWPTLEANAALIAAAPALYEALESAREAIHWAIVDGRSLAGDQARLDAADAALRLARGEG